MSNVLRHRGYAARVEFDAEDHIFFGSIAGIGDKVGFHADTVSDLEAAFREAVDDYVDTCAKVGKDPQRPFSGSLQFRVTPELHANVAIAAELSGKSLNQWGEEVLRRAAEPVAA
ncbi:Predicted nuclease of the RNAse H fold, HicB family [Methylobacterium phyllostachyos]|uniref:Predicted nuclease of the RNAse H fold, HicB family n=1 Tax=Methylobacterium phyllostachyos TaxID=582672 RepID=A0A1H0K7J3_9HYPH|nr:type II toxin-antitoxin system HicB family antitoxin [Methylobacterium phyllostachyos]SDO51720.1 Predicted nuclease of the RNAse H fold, HicB family [Methylobacterium phyllostachyos]